jgi:hypothetical protein
LHFSVDFFAVFSFYGALAHFSIALFTIFRFSLRFFRLAANKAFIEAALRRSIILQKGRKRDKSPVF